MPSPDLLSHFRPHLSLLTLLREAAASPPSTLNSYRQLPVSDLELSPQVLLSHSFCLTPYVSSAPCVGLELGYPSGLTLVSWLWNFTNHIYLRLIHTYIFVVHKRFCIAFTLKQKWYLLRPSWHLDWPTMALGFLPRSQLFPKGVSFICTLVATHVSSASQRRLLLINKE